MSIFRRNRKEAQLILFFSCLKLALHLVANRNFGFHRDEFLYLALGEHLDWGFKEVPPFIAFVSWLSTHLFGDSVFAARIIPSLFGALIVYLTGLMVVAMGGKRFAVSVACLGLIVSPAFLASQYLLQPVVFDQFFWVLNAYLAVKYVQTKRIAYLYWIGAASGLGMLNKYSMLFYTVGLVGGMVISNQRKLLWNKHVAGACLVGLIVFMPNLIWQVANGLPVIKHMNELKETQLDYVSPGGFIMEQLLVHVTGLLIWLPGLVYLFASRVRSKFTFVSAAFLITMVLLIVLHGKPYYGFGAYPALFAAGGLCWQRVMSRVTEPLRSGILAACLAPTLIFLPIAIPMLSFPKTLTFFQFTTQKMNMDFITKWEDQKIHATSQDYADMLGWDEIAANVNKAYSMLNHIEKKSATIFAANYGMAGAIDHLGKKYMLPKAVSLNSSYLLWAPADIQTSHMIYIDTDADDISRAYKTTRKIGEVLNPYAREKGTSVYLLSDPVIDVNQLYKNHKAIE